MLSLPPTNEVCEGYVFTPVCQSFCSQGWGMCGCMGGMHGCGGHAWLQGAVCMVVRGVCGYRGCVWLWGCTWLQGGMHGCRGHACLWGACMVVGGMCGGKGDVRGIRRDTVYEWAVCILRECILVNKCFEMKY